MIVNFDTLRHNQSNCVVARGAVYEAVSFFLGFTLYRLFYRYIPSLQRRPHKSPLQSSLRVKQFWLKLGQQQQLRLGLQWQQLFRVKLQQQ